MNVCMIIGDPIAHSLSPEIHNAAYHALNIDDSYRYEARQVRPDELEAFMDEVRKAGILGVSCTIPHKEAVMDYIDEVDSIAAKIGAVNTVVNANGTLKGYNTDWLGAVLPLEQLIELHGKRVALLGAGGAARAIAYGLASKEADVTIYNRTAEKAQQLAQDFGARSASSEDAAAIRNADIIINATSVGMEPNENDTPIAQELISDHQIVFDSIYSPYETRLLRDAKGQGAQVVHGTEMLLQQAIAQFKLYTGYDAPEEAMRTALEKAL